MDFESKDLPTDSKEFAMENRRITEELGYVPEYPIERGIASFIEWIKEGKY